MTGHTQTRRHTLHTHTTPVDTQTPVLSAARAICCNTRPHQIEPPLSLSVILILFLLISSEALKQRLLKQMSDNTPKHW